MLQLIYEYTYVYIYVYTVYNAYKRGYCTFVYATAHTCMYVQTFVSVAFRSVLASVHVHLYADVYICMCVYVYTFVYVSFHMCVHMVYVFVLFIFVVCH
jgi:hypothetical protein